MCKVSRDAREEFEGKYGSPMQWLSKKLAVAECDSSSRQESSEEDDSESGDDWIKPVKGAERKRSSGKSKKGDKHPRGSRFLRSWGPGGIAPDR